jgi:hypothetical protein
MPDDCEHNRVKSKCWECLREEVAGLLAAADADALIIGILNAMLADIGNPRHWLTGPRGRSKPES